MSATVEEATKQMCHLGDWELTHLQLQKLLYAANLLYIAKYHEALINDDEFHTFMDGPILLSLAAQLRCFGKRNIPNIFYATNSLSNKENEILELAYKSFFPNPKALLRLNVGKGLAWERCHTFPSIAIPLEELQKDCETFFGNKIKKKLGKLPKD